MVGRRCPHRAADGVARSRRAEDSQALPGALTSAAVVVLLFGIAINSARAAVIFDVYSAYHYIEVTDNGGVRMLSFNGSMETRMHVNQPLPRKPEDRCDVASHHVFLLASRFQRG